MKKKFTIIGLGLLVLLALAAPVMAASPKKIPVVFSTAGAKTDYADATTIINPDGTKHVWGAVRTAKCYLTMGSGPQLVGSVRVDLDYIIFPDGTTIQHYHKMTLTFQAQAGLSNGGTFVGVITWRADLDDYAGTFESHSTFQGSGDFEGYTMHLDRNIDKPSVAWMLIH